MFKCICHKSLMYTVNVQYALAIYTVCAACTCRVVVLYNKGMGASILKTSSQKRAFYDETYLKYPKFSSLTPAVLAIFTYFRSPVRLAQYHTLYSKRVINELLNIRSIHVKSYGFRKHKLSIIKYVDAVDLSCALG